MIRTLIDIGAGLVFAAALLLALLWWETREMRDDGEWRE
jgi:hypothetical protein